MLICRSKEGTGRRVTRGELKNLGGAPTATSPRALGPSDVQPCASPQLGGAFLLQTLAIADEGGRQGDLIAHRAASTGARIGCLLLKVTYHTCAESGQLLFCLSVQR